MFSEHSRGIIWTDPDHVRILRTAFVQDEIAIVPERVSVTLGSKVDHTTDTGFSLHPSARVLWRPRGSQTIWAAVSQAFRTPDLFESGARLDVSAFQPGPQSPVVQVTMFGQPDLKDERLTSYEIGYRAEPTSRWTIDVATFYSVYADLIDFLPGEPAFETSPSPGHLVLPLRAANTGGGRSFGIEASAQWTPATFWRLTPSYTFLDIPVLEGSREFDSPRHRAGLRSYLALPRSVGLNAAAYYVGELRTARIPAYTRLDLGLTWRAAESIELGIWGQNLLDARHVEFFTLSSPQREAVTRGVVAQVTWRPRGF